MRRIGLRVVGVPCATCLIPVREALKRLEGVKNVGANYAVDLILVDYDPSDTSAEEIVETVRKKGYAAVPVYRR
jgi:copper chaperone CopZ